VLRQHLKLRGIGTKKNRHANEHLIPKKTTRSNKPWFRGYRLRRTTSSFQHFQLGAFKGCLDLASGARTGCQNGLGPKPNMIGRPIWPYGKPRPGPGLTSLLVCWLGKVHTQTLAAAWAWALIYTPDPQQSTKMGRTIGIIPGERKSEDLHPLPQNYPLCYSNFRLQFACLLSVHVLYRERKKYWRRKWWWTWALEGSDNKPVSVGLKVWKEKSTWAPQGTNG